MEIQDFIWKNSHELNKLHNNFPHYKFSIKYILQFFKEKHGKNKQTKSFPSAEKCLDLVSRWWRTPQLLPQLDLFSQKTKKNPSDNKKKPKHRAQGLAVSPPSEDKHHGGIFRHPQPVKWQSVQRKDFGSQKPQTQRGAELFRLSLLPGEHRGMLTPWFLWSSQV